MAQFGSKYYKDKRKKEELANVPFYLRQQVEMISNATMEPQSSVAARLTGGGSVNSGSVNSDARNRLEGNMMARYQADYDEEQRQQRMLDFQKNATTREDIAKGLKDEYKEAKSDYHSSKWESYKENPKRAIADIITVGEDSSLYKAAYEKVTAKEKARRKAQNEMMQKKSNYINYQNEPDAMIEKLSGTGPYERLRKNADFAEKSVSDRTVKDNVYLAITGDDEQRAGYAVQMGVQGIQHGLPAIYEYGQYMTEDQRKLYTYIYNTKGKKEANNYLKKYLSKELIAKRNKADDATWEEISDDYPILGSAFARGAHQVNRVTGLMQSAMDVMDMEEEHPFFYNKAASTGRVINTIDTRLTENMADESGVLGTKIKLFGQDKGNLSQFLYSGISQQVDSVIDSLTLGQGMIGGLSAKQATNGVLGQLAVNVSRMGAIYSQSYDNMVRNGVPKERAVADASADAVIETVFEMIGDKPLDLIPADSALAKNIITIAGESLEELEGGIADTAVDILMNKERSEISTRIYELMQNGYNAEQAQAQALKEITSDTLYSAMIAAVSSAGSVAVNQGVVSSINARNNRAIGRSVSGNDTYDNLLNIVATADQDSKLYDMAVKLNDSKKISTKKIGELTTEIYRYNAESQDKSKLNVVTEALESNGVENAEEIAPKVLEVYTGKRHGSAKTRALVQAIKENGELSNYVDAAIDTIEYNAVSMENYVTSLVNGNTKAASLAEYQTEVGKLTTDEYFDYTSTRNISKENARSEASAAVNTKQNAPVTEQYSDDERAALESNEIVSKAELSGRLVNKDGQTFAKLKDGDLVAADKVRYANEEQAYVYNNVGDISSSAAEILTKEYDNGKYSGADVNAFLTEGKAYYKYGLSATADYEDIKSVVGLGVLSDDVARRMYETGQAQARIDGSKTKIAVTERTPNKGGVVTAKDDAVLSQQEEMVYGTISKLTGLDIEFVYDEDTDAEGYTFSKSGKITINKAADDPYKAFLHEFFGEFTTAWNKAEADGLVNEILLYMMQDEKYKGNNKLIKEIEAYQKAYDKDPYQDVVRERVFNYMADIVESPEGAERFAEWVDSQYSEEWKKSILEQFKEFLHKFVAAIKDIMRINMDSAQYNTAEKRLNAKEKEILDHIFSTTEGAVRHFKAANNSDIELIDDEESRYSLKPYSEHQLKNWENSKNIIIYKSQSQLQKFIDNARSHKNLSKKMYFGIIGDDIADFIYNNTGIDVHNYNAVLRADSILKIFDSHGNEIKEAQRGQRAITDNDILLLPELFGKIDFAEYAGKYTKMQGNNDFINVKSSIEPTITIGLIVQNKQLDIRVQTMYATKKGNNTVAVNALNNSPLPVTSETDNGNVSSTNISKSGTDVKRNSKKVDSEGNALTEAQEEYFKDSKVRDENGNLLVVYHGTDADFTVFDRTKSRSNMDIQGNFFSPWDIDARGYGPNVKAYYLNIKNPAPEGEGYKALNMYKGQNGAGIKAREYLISMGYDGVNNGNEEYIAFYPEQIKVVDNLNPTESDDVRYAKKVDEYTYDTLVSKPDMHITRIDDRKNYVPNKQTRKGIVDNALKSAISVGHKDASGNTYVYVDDIDTNILVSKRGLQHSLDRRLGIVAPVTENIGPILKNSIRINEMTPKSDTIENSYVLIGIAKNGKNEPYVVSFVVNKASNEITSVDVLYAVNAKTEPVGSLSPELSSRGDVSLTGSDISISDLLDYVNKYYPDVLPEDVLKHYGYDRRPNGKLGDSALYSKRVEPVNDNLLNELNDAYQQARKSISEQRQQLIKDKYTKMRLEQETKPGRHISVTRAKAINNILKKRYNSKLDSTVGTRDILRLYDAYIEKGTSDDTVMQMAEDVAKAYLLNVKAEKTLDSYAKTVLDDLRGMRITLSEMQKKEAAYTYGSVKAYKNKLFGKGIIVTANGGMMLDEKFGDLVETYPGTFQETADVNQPQALLDAVTSLSNSYSYSDDGLNIDDEAKIIAVEIFDMLNDAPGHTTAAEALRKSVEKETQIRLKQQQRIKRNEQELKRKIKAIRNDLVSRLTSPKGNRYVPKELVHAVIAVDEAINFDTTNYQKRIEMYERRIANETDETKKAELRQTYNRLVSYHIKQEQKIAELKAAYDKYKNDKTFSDVWDETISNLISRLEQKVGGVPMHEMSYEQIELVYNTLKAVQTTVKNSIKLINSDIKTNKYETATEAIKETNESARLHGNGLKNAIAKGAMTLLSVQRAFNMLGGYKSNSVWLKLYNMLNEGQHKEMEFMQGASNYFTHLLVDEKGRERSDFKKFRSAKDVVDLGIKDAEGNAVMVNHAFLVDLHLHMQNKDNRRHIEYSGFTVPDMRMYQKHSPDVYNKQGKGHRVHNLGVEGTLKLAETIEKNLTEYDREWIKAIRSCIDEFMTPKLNQATLDRYGFKKATVDNYWRIYTDPNYVNAPMESVIKDSSIENASFMKDRANGTNPLLIGDASDLIGRMIKGNAHYSAMMIPIHNFNLVYNTQMIGYDESVKSAVADAFGKKAQKYIEGIMGDLNGNDRGKHSKLISMVRGNYAQAVLTTNIPVSIKQAASYPAAAAVVGHKALVKALAAPVKEDGNKRLVFMKAEKAAIEKWSPLLRYRLQSGALAEIGEINSNEGLVNTVINKVPALFNWIQQIDGMTVGRLWYAAKYYVEDNYNYKVGSDEYYKEVAKVFNDAVELTQPNYTALQRSEFQRGGSEIRKSIFMFMTQRMQNLNILYDAAADYNINRKRYKAQSITKDEFHQSKARYANAVSSQIVSAVVLCVMNLVSKMLLGNMFNYKDDDDEVTVESVLEGVGKDLLSTVMGTIPLGSQIYDAVYAAITGEKHYDINVAGVAEINDTVDQIIDDVRTVSDIASGDSDDAEEKILGIINDTLSTTSKVFGIPYDNMRRIAQGIKNGITDIKNGDFGTWNASSNRSIAQSSGILYRSILNGDDERKERSVNELLEQGLDKENIQSHLKSELVNNNTDVAEAAFAYIDGNLNQYIKYIDSVRKSGFNETLVEDAVSQYVSNVETAKKLKDAGDEKKYQKALDKLINSGIEIERVEKVVDNVDATYTFSKQDKKALYNSILKGDEKKYKELVYGHEENNIYNAITTGLVSYDKRIAKAGVAIMNNDTATFDSVVNEVVKDGFDEKNVVDAIDSYCGKIKSAKKALNEGDKQSYIDTINDLTESGYDMPKIVKSINDVEIKESGEGESHIYSTDKVISAVESGDTEFYDRFADNVYARSDGYQLLYAVLKKYGYNSYEYKQAEERCVNAKVEYTTSENPNPEQSMKTKALKEYIDLMDNNASRNEIQIARNRCIQLYGTVAKVDKAVKDYYDKKAKKEEKKQKRIATFGNK